MAITTTTSYQILTVVSNQKKLQYLSFKEAEKSDFLVTYSFTKKYLVDFDDELKIGDVRYNNMTKITLKVQLFWRLPYKT